MESLTTGPELENDQDPKATLACFLLSLWIKSINEMAATSA